MFPISSRKSQFQLEFYQLLLQMIGMVYYEVDITPLLYFLVARKNGRITNVRFHVVCIFYTYTLKWPLFKMMNKLQMNCLNIALIFCCCYVFIFLQSCQKISHVDLYRSASCSNGNLNPIPTKCCEEKALQHFGLSKVENKSWSLNFKL